MIAPAHISRPTLSVVTLVNRDELYSVMRESLAEQHAPSDIEWLPIHADARSLNAAQGLNDGINRATGRWIICAHQDVLFPEGWWKLAQQQLDSWEGDIGVAGLVGVNRMGQFKGHVLDPHGHCLWRPLPTRVASIDEHVVILPGDTQLRFDEANPGFHCYATDIALSARAGGLDAIVIGAPVVHLSGGNADASFDRCAQWLLRKWGPACGGVIPTCCGVLSTQALRAKVRSARLRLNMRLSIRNFRAPLGTLTGAQGVYRSAMIDQP